MDRSLAKIGTLTQIGEVLLFARNFSRSLGCLRMSYHFTPEFAEPTSVDTIVYADGFSDEWLDLYDRFDFRQHDPIPDRTMRHGAMLSWEDALDLAPLNLEQSNYAHQMHQSGLMHGFGLPIFGPKGRHAYSAFDFGKPLADIPEEAKAKLAAVARTSHLRICEILEATQERPQLSEREDEVLRLIAAGKSNTDIGTILDISSETVRTYTQRLYDKMEVRDRISAAIKALKLGMLRA